MIGENSARRDGNCSDVIGGKEAHREETHTHSGIAVGIMSRKAARVCGAATQIPLDGERVAGGAQCAWVRGTTEDVVVLAGVGDELQVADARAFCAGSVAVQRVVELPRDATLGTGNDGGKYGVAWVNTQRRETEVYVVDFQSGEVAANYLPTLNDEIVDAFVDASGAQIVAVGGVSGKLWGWNSYSYEYNKAAESWERCEWREIGETAIESSWAHFSSRGCFVNSAVMGNCFVLLRAIEFSNGSVVLERWTLDVDERWSTGSFSSVDIGNTDPDTTQGIRLFTNKSGTFAAIAIGCAMYHVNTDQDLRNSVVHRILLDHEIINGTWIDHNTAFAMLLANGTLTITRKGIREAVESRGSRTAHGILDVTRITLRRSWDMFESMYFKLIRIIHEQLAGDSVNCGRSRDPIDCIGKSVKLFEILTSLTIAMPEEFLRQLSTKVLSALSGRSTNGSDEALYYRQEMNAISRQVRILLAGVSETEDWWSYSFEATIFLHVYFAKTLQLVLNVRYDTTLAEERLIATSDALSSFQQVIEHDGYSTGAESLTKITKSCDSSFGRLKQLIVSYALMCSSLQVNGVVIDLGHFFSLDLPPGILKRKEIFCCFMKPRQSVVHSGSVQENDRLSDMIATAAEFAIEANALQLTMHFCLVSRSCMVHQCLQVLCGAAANMATDKPLPHGRLDVNKLHWLACEIYIGEIMAIFQQIGACRQFKHSMRAAECNVNALDFPDAIDREFDIYQDALSTMKDGHRAQCFIKDRLWEFSHHDTHLRARVICLISRIAWHLEAVHGEPNNLIRCSFGSVLFDPQIEELPAEAKTVQDSIMKVREIVTVTEAELRIPRFRQPADTQTMLSYKSQKLTRTLVLIAWALWIREKAAYCSRIYHRHVHDEKRDTEKAVLGAIAATCALHLNAVGILCGYTEELFSIQMALLEGAAMINPCKSVTAIAWGFPQRKILTKRLKRYKVVRQAVRLAALKAPLEEYEIQYENLKTRIRWAFHQIHKDQIYPETDDIDMLMSCYCDPEFFQILAVLTRSPTEVVIVSSSFTDSSNSMDETSNVVQEFSEASTVKAGLPLFAPDTVLKPASQIERVQNPPISGSQISRYEVMTLLREQTRCLEENICAVSFTSSHEESRPSILLESHDAAHKTKAEDTHLGLVHKITRSASEISPETTGEMSTELSNAQRMPRISLQIRTLNRPRYSPVSLKAGSPVNQQLKPTQRHDSIHNAIKLFRLRQEHICHVRSDKEDPISIKVGELTRTVSDSNTASDTHDPVLLSPHRQKLKYAGVKRKSSRSQRSSDQVKLSSSKEPVYPLRLAYGAEVARLKLLGRSTQLRNPSMKKRQFVNEQERTKSNTYEVKSRYAMPMAESTEAIELKTSSAQTNNIGEVAEPPVLVAKEMKNWAYQQNEIGPEKDSPVPHKVNKSEQIYSTPNVANSGSSQTDIGIQCRVFNDELTESHHMRRVRGPPPLNIADKFPIWVELGGVGSTGEKQHFKERKSFLQIARFGSREGAADSINNGSIEDSQLFPSSPTFSAILVPRKQSSGDSSNENQSDGHHSPTVGSVYAEEDRAIQQTNKMLRAKYRASYRQHYPARERLSRTSGDRDSASGIDTLIDLRDNMQRMTQRLRVLETCANSIDEEFKNSQKVSLHVSTDVFPT
ncbi:unnamed protein product [Phytophthora fragariaefolia]|uniref:Unnamed protein product n=1 Tax=Phytophthora fragariaefolia TaxID=1490495 RepID=A0A9W6UFI2_9STRA|nr:unnamed protein product [Phytophthora fragariaefolia]